MSVTVTDGSSEVPDNSLLVGGFDVRVSQSSSTAVRIILYLWLFG